MAKQPTPLLIKPKPGVQRDGTRFDADAYSDAQWVRFQRGLPRKIGGWRTMTDSHANIPRAIDSYSRDAVTYVHVGHGDGLDQFTINSAGNPSALTSRTPTIFTTGDDVCWQFERITDPIDYTPHLIGHAAPNLNSICSCTERPLFWGDVDSTDILTPMALPIRDTAFTVTTFTGTTSIGSPVVTAIADTSLLTKNMRVSGTGIPANTRILSVDSGTQITMTANATGAASPTITAAVGGVSGGVVVLHPYVLALGASGVVNWSTATDPNDFWDTGSGEALITEQNLIRGMIARGGPSASPSGLIWSLNALVRVNFVGGTATWAFDTVSDDITVMSARSIVEHLGTFYWAGIDGFMAYNGALRPIPNDRSTNWFFDNINYAARGKVFAFKNTRWNEIWWCYPRGSATECTHAVIYNYATGDWYDTELPASGRSCAQPQAVFRYPLMGGVDEGPDGYRVIQHETGTDDIDGSTIRPVYAMFETNDVTLATSQEPSNASLECLVVEQDFVQTGDMEVTVTGNMNARSPVRSGDAITFPAEASSPDEQITRTKVAARQLRFKFVSNEIGGNFEMGKVLAHVQPTDMRITT